MWNYGKNFFQVQRFTRQMNVDTSLISRTLTKMAGTIIRQEVELKLWGAQNSCLRVSDDFYMYTPSNKDLQKRPAVFIASFFIIAITNRYSIWKTFGYLHSRKMEAPLKAKILPVAVQLWPYASAVAQGHCCKNHVSFLLEKNLNLVLRRNQTA